MKEMELAALPVIAEDVSVNRIIELLIRSGANKLLVVNSENRLQGIITIMDLVTAEAQSAP